MSALQEKEEIVRIIKEFGLGERAAYNKLVERIAGLQGYPKECIPCLHALSGCASLIHGKYHHLVESCLSLDWVAMAKMYNDANDKDTAVQAMKAFQKFGLQLVSAHRMWLEPLFKTLVMKLLPIRDFSHVGRDGKVDDATLWMWNGARATILRLLKLFPTAFRVAETILRSVYPHCRLDAVIQRAWLLNILYIASQAPSMQKIIISMVVVHLLELDVEVRTSDDSPDIVPLFPMKEDMEAEQEARDKMDDMMWLTLRFLGETAKERGRGKTLFAAVLSAFDQYVFHTHKSQFVQFLMFVMCAAEPEVFGNTFLTYLYHRLKEDTANHLSRCTAVAYVGSFVARARFLSHKVIVEAIHTLVEASHQLLSHKDVHTELFLSLNQAWMYIFCYRHRTLEEEGVDLIGLWRTLKVEVLLHSKYAPLVMCDRKVSLEFCRLSHRVGWLKLRALANRQFAKLIGEGEEDDLAQPLQLFFPFDPCALPRSKEMIQPLYLFWTDVVVEKGDEESEDDEEEEEEDGKEDVRGIRIVRKPIPPPEAVQYSISPSPGFQWRSPDLLPRKEEQVESMELGPSVQLSMESYGYRKDRRQMPWRR